MGARTAQGTTLWVDTLLASTGATPTFPTQVICPTSIGDIGGGDRTEIDVSTLCSMSKEFLLGLRDEGELTIELPWCATDAGQSIVQTAYDDNGAGNRLSFQIRVPADGTDPAVNFTFEALVKQFSKSMAVDEYIKGSMSLRIVTPIAQS